MAVTRCKCGQYIEWVKILGGRRLPFLHDLVAVAEAPPDAWGMISVGTGKGQHTPVAAPLERIRGQVRQNLRWVLIRHECPLWEKREHDAPHPRAVQPG